MSLYESDKKEIREIVQEEIMEGRQGTIRLVTISICIVLIFLMMFITILICNNNKIKLEKEKMQIQTYGEINYEQ